MLVKPFQHRLAAFVKDVYKRQLQGKIQIVLILREHTVFNRLPHGTARLVFVGAVAEAALPCFFVNIPKNFVKPLFRLAKDVYKRQMPR